MAMIKCPECGRDISDQAGACPHCGYPLKKGEAAGVVVHDQKEEAFAKYVQDRVAHGWQIIDKERYLAILMLPAATVNHILHLLLSIVTVGIWLIVWLIVALGARGEQRIRAEVNDDLSMTEFNPRTNAAICNRVLNEKTGIWEYRPCVRPASVPTTGGTQ